MSIRSRFIFAGNSVGSIHGLMGLPGLRLAATCLAVTALAFAGIVEQLISKMESVTGRFNGLVVLRRLHGCARGLRWLGVAGCRHPALTAWTSTTREA
ncbi:hypothetical protein BKK81_30755 [Cupriavidus sp. USMAHM13]|uniref:Uncharacterized protein n=1 Tax=Cupriavidus malaysiensis TaxID=367825 RepID=A0ABN4TQ15_9BURK|nr:MULTISPECIES: hypothetical protein [Cupriavidus]AOZ03444.1 hypothetical protein BKK81_30755 [Cupriavidus sp. USMAHM13]AOZ09194.1 hypothetical protein BKK80_25600 [Cupriavidus malaysiensis]